MLSLSMGEDTHIIFRSCGLHGSFGLSANGSRCDQMHFSVIASVVTSSFALVLWGAFLLALLSSKVSVAADETLSGMAMSYASAVSAGHHGSQEAALHEGAYGVLRISNSDLQQRQALERSIQLAAFQQFDSRKTGQLYNVSVSGVSSGDARAIRLRSGSFKRYGVIINEFTIPRGCIVDPIPERILLVYTRFPSTTLFQSVPAGYALASSVLSVIVYDATNLNSSQPPEQLTVSTTTSLISIGFPQTISSKCAYFSDNTTAVNITDSVQGVCQVDHLGTFALVSSMLAPGPAPTGAQSPPPSRPKKNSNTWRIVVGSVIGGLALLALLTLLALGIGRRRKHAKLSRMEYQAEQGETLQMATIRNSRVPTATNTRTQATLVNDYAV